MRYTHFAIVAVSMAALAAAAQAQPPSAQAPSAMARGAKAYNDAKYPDAIAAMTEVLASQPTNPDRSTALLVRGEAKAAQGDCRAAIVDLEASSKLQPAGEVSADIGFCDYRLGDYPGTIANLRTYLVAKPNDVPSLVLLGKAQISTQRNADAEASFRKAIAVDPKAKEALVLLGATLEARQAYRDAEGVYRQATALDAKSFPAQMGLGASLIAQKRYADAMAPLQAAVTINPNNTQAASALAMAKSGGVGATAVAAAATPPRSIDANSPLGRGIRLYRDQEFKPALKQFQAATQADAKDALAFAYTGDAYHHLGQEAEAKAAYAAATKLDPGILNTPR